jgi:hypothetical protein
MSNNIIEGNCVLFAGLKYIDSDNEEHNGMLNEYNLYQAYWIQEPIELTTQRLKNGLETLNLNLLDINIKHYFYEDGQLSINFTCEHNNDVQLFRDMYINGIKTFDWQDEVSCQLEITFPNIPF